MALPKLNENLKYELVIPSSEQTVTFRPYLVKEEKVLLNAFEQQDQKLAMRAMVDTVVSCVYDEINPKDLSTFDVEYMFTQIRAKSVGETATIKIKCESCEHENEHTIDLTQAQVEKEEVDTVIPITDDISIEMKYPSYESFVNHFVDGMSEAEFGFAMLSECLVSIMTEEENHLVSEVSKNELNEFIDSMTNAQFAKVGEFFNTVPVMRKHVEFTCSNCGHENKTKLEGLQDFF